MTGKERILRTLRREPHDRVPFVPNIWQWFYHHKYQGTLPAELQGCDSYVDALRVLGADIIYKLGGLETYSFRGCGYESWFEGQRPRIPAVTERLLFTDGLVFKEKWSTPHGVLSHEWTYREMDGTAVETGRILKDDDFAAHYEAIRSWLERRTISIDFARFRQGLEEVGEDGLVPVYLSSTPLKQMHWLARQDGASLLIYDHPDEVRELMRLHEEQVLAHTQNVVDLDGAWLFVIRDNVDSLFCHCWESVRLQSSSALQRPARWAKRQSGTCPRWRRCASCWPACRSSGRFRPPRAAPGAPKRPGGPPASCSPRVPCCSWPICLEARSSMPGPSSRPRRRPASPSRPSGRPCWPSPAGRPARLGERPGLPHGFRMRSCSSSSFLPRALSAWAGSISADARRYRAEVERQLSAVAELKASELAQSRSERLGDASVFLSDAPFSALVRRVLDNPQDAEAEAQLRTWLTKVQTHHAYDTSIARSSGAG